MARLRYAYGEAEPPRDVAANLIPGLVYNRAENAAYGHVDGLAGIGVEVERLWPQLWTGGSLSTKPLQLREYQHKAVDWCIDSLNRYGGAILADDMGLGKTRTAIYTASQLLHNQHTLIVAPASVLYQWQEEAKVFNLPGHILGPPSNKKFGKQWDDLSQGLQSIYITSYQLALKALANSSHMFKCIILDEPHMFLRGRTGKLIHGSDGHAGLKEYMPQIRYRLAATGTPMFNKPRDLWPLLWLLFGSRFGKGKDFDARYCDGKQGQYGWTNSGATNTGELKRRLSYYMLRRTLEDVKLELPPLTTSFRWVEASKSAQAAMIGAGGVNAASTDKALHACLDSKIPLVIEIALEQQGPTVIFTYHRHHAEEIAAEVEKAGKPCVSIHGGLTVETRHKLIQHCAATGTSVAATIDSCGTGVNMQGVASQGIFHTIERSPKKTHQAMKRLHRSGQTQPVHWVFTAMKDAMDEIVVDEVLKRLDYWNKIMGSDDMQDNVGEALVVSEDTEDAVLKAIYSAMKG